MERQAVGRTAGALRVACFCAGIFSLSCFAVTVGTVAAFHIVRTPALRGYHYEFAVFIGMLGMIAAVFVFYIGGVARRMRYVRYANS